MAIVIKTIKRRQYRYQQYSYRVGKKVKTRSKYLGPVGGGATGGWTEAMERETRAWDSAMRDAVAIEKEQREKFGGTPSERQTREHKEHMEKLHDAYGLKMGLDQPEEIEKVSSPTIAPEKTEQDAASSHPQGHDSPSEKSDV